MWHFFDDLYMFLCFFMYVHDMMILMICMYILYLFYMFWQNLTKLTVFGQVPSDDSRFGTGSIFHPFLIYIYIYYISLSFVRNVYGILGFGELFVPNIPTFHHIPDVFCAFLSVYIVYNKALHWWYCLPSFHILATKMDGMMGREEQKWKVFIFFLRGIVRSP